MGIRQSEQKAARTTIVGERPPDSGRENTSIPRGIEVLVKKAVVDPEFRELLFEQRGGAAAAIALELDPAENVMLNAITREQLSQIVSQSVVPLEQRRVFLGRFAAAMLAVLGAGLAGCEPGKTRGTAADRPEKRLAKADSATPVFKLMGIQPDSPDGQGTNAPSLVPPEPSPPRTNNPPTKPTPRPPATNKPSVFLAGDIHLDCP